MYFPFPRPGPGGSPMADPGSRAMGGIHGKDGRGTRWTSPSQPLGVQQNGWTFGLVIYGYPLVNIQKTIENGHL